MHTRACGDNAMSVVGLLDVTHKQLGPEPNKHARRTRTATTVAILVISFAT